MRNHCPSNHTAFERALNVENMLSIAHHFATHDIYIYSVFNFTDGAVDAVAFVWAMYCTSCCCCSYAVRCCCRFDFGQSCRCHRHRCCCCCCRIYRRRCLLWRLWLWCCWLCGCRCCCCYNLIELRAALVGFADKSTGSGSRRGQLGSIQKAPHKWMDCPPSWLLGLQQSHRFVAAAYRVLWVAGLRG